MPAVSWIMARERVVGKGSSRFDDVANRPLRQIFALTGLDPDDPSFQGLGHFPNGIHTNDISEHTLGSGITVHNDAVFSQAVTFDETVNFQGAEFAAAVTFDDNVTINGNLAIVGSLTAGSISGTFPTLRVNQFNMGNTKDLVLGYPIQKIGNSSLLQLDGDTSILTWFCRDFVEVIWSMKSGSDVGDNDAIHFINNIGLFASNGIEFLANVVLMQDLATRGTRFVVPFDGIYQSSFNLAGVANLATAEKLIDRGETGWTAGTGTQTKGGLDTSTATAAQIAAVVNALVNALMSHHKLIRA